MLSFAPGLEVAKEPHATYYRIGMVGTRDGVLRRVILLERPFFIEKLGAFLKETARYTFQALQTT